MGKVIGIDLGTTNSCVAYVDSDGSFKVIPTRSGANTMPSVVAFDKANQRLIGQVAKRQPPSENILYETKRLIGRRYSEIESEIKNLAYNVVNSKNGDAWVQVRGTDYSPVQIASFILMELKEDAQAYLGEKVTQAVITVPAYFDDAQRQATKDAGTLAGLEVLRIINEPTAAALAYGLDKNKTGTIAVYDLGGGTFDVSILHIEDGVFEVLSTNGNTMLGGGDFDQAIVRYLIDEYKAQNGVALDVEGDKMVLQRLRTAAEQAKIELSSSLQTDINLPFLTADASGPKHLNAMLSRAKLEALVEGLIKKTIEPCRKALQDAKLSASDLTDVVLVGGMTRMPKVIDAVRDFFGREPHRGVNPDEVVALGAAAQGSILAGDTKDVVLLDVSSLSVGIETEGSVMTVMIPRNTTIPTKKSQVFSTAADSQTSVTIKVYQGERTMAADNKYLGEFELRDIVPAPRGTPQIEVTFAIDSNGIMNVSAKDKGTGKEQSIRITANSGLSKEEIERMVADAKAYEEEDKKKRDLIEKRNHAESLQHSIKKNLEEHGAKLTDDEKKNVEDALSRMEQVKDTDDINVLINAIDDLTKNSMKLGEIVYNSQAKDGKADQDQSSDSSSNNSGDDVVDIN